VRSRKGRFPLLIAVAAVAVLAQPARAATWGGEVFGAYSTYSMKDWNDLTQVANDTLGTNLDEIHGGLGGGLGVRVWATSNWMFSAVWEPLFADTKDDANGIEIQLNGQSFQGTAAYFFPTRGTGKFGIGAGLGYYRLSGEDTAPGFAKEKIEGSSVGFHFLGLGELEVSPGFAVTGAVGYRVAKISDTQFDGLSTVPKFETDYSGLMLRAGVAFYVTPR
jgi:hypothetical protein